MVEFASSRDLSLEQLKFSFDGDKVNPESTPEELDMEDGDCIDVGVVVPSLSS